MEPSATQPATRIGPPASPPSAQPAPPQQWANPQATAPAAKSASEPSSSSNSNESTLIVRGRLSNPGFGMAPNSEAPPPELPVKKTRWGLIVVGSIGLFAFGSLLALFALGIVPNIFGSGRGTVASTTGVPVTVPPTPPIPTPPTPIPTAVGLDAALVDAGVDSGVDAGFDAGVDAGFDAGFDAGLVAEVVPPVEPVPVVPVVPVAPVATGNVAGITPDSELPESGPRASDILVGDATRLMEAGQLDAAGTALTRAMERDRINPQGFEAFAFYHIARRDFPAAIAAATRATELRSHESRYQLVLGNAYLGAGDLAAARAAWQRAVSEDRNRDARAQLEAHPAP
jgi:hypothetical protein